MSKPFLWLSSYPKSANTWVRMFLGACLCDGHVNINNLPRRCGNSDLQPYYYQSVSPLPLPCLDYYRVLQLRQAVLVHISYFGGEWPIPIKTHHARVRACGTDLIPPQVTEKAVYIIRDPRDVAVSFSHHNEEPLDQIIERMGNPGALLHSKKEHEKTLFHFLSSWSHHVDSWMRSPFPCEAFTYEGFVEDPEKHFRRLLEFIEWEVDEDTFQKALENTSFDRLQFLEKQKGFRESPAESFFRKGKVGGWKDVLTKEQSDKIEEDHKEVMTKLGYLE